MSGINCWEFMKCGREPGGAKIGQEGPCPSATAVEHNGINHGTNGGRRCWRVVDTVCTNRPQGSIVDKASTCGKCPFFALVLREEGSAFVY